MMLASFLWIFNPMKQVAPKNLHYCNSLLGYWFLRNLMTTLEALRKDPTKKSRIAVILNDKK